jgi:hypothetical protein
MPMSVRSSTISLRPIEPPRRWLCQIIAKQFYFARATAAGHRWRLLGLINTKLGLSRPPPKRHRTADRVSLAFLAPQLAKAAVEGRLLRGINIERLRNPHAEWGRQFEELGLDPD